MMSLAQTIAADLSLPHQGVASVLSLLAEKATIPFIARYRKERTGGLDEVQLRAISDRLRLVTELSDRRAAIKKALTESGKLTDALARQLDACTR
ncbi:MAG: hypothetical protein ACI9MR_004114, partial [Myxococcota bacterium]